ncbi:MAG TPA: diguanylate cyclase [Gammaproteobacteria bacterium]|nr:diguanylate cyclase [Gammaproteobacteria bacterium]
MLKNNIISVRYRMVSGLVVLVLPMLLLVGLIYFLFHQTVSSFDEVTEELLHELAPLSEVQRAVLEVSYSVDDYFLRADPTSRGRFIRASKQINMLRKQLREIGFSDDSEKLILARAERFWHQAHSAGLDLLDGKGSEDETKAKLDHFHQIIYSMLTELDKIYVVSQTEVEVEHTSVRQNQSRIDLLLYASVSVTLILIILLGVWLVRQVTRPLEILEQGVDRLAAGELSHRIILPDGRNEFHKLADAINHMSKEIESQVMQDGLTRLLNRRAFDDRLNDEYSRSKRYNQPLSLLMLDLDHFKQVNDKYGHPAGDEVLRQIAQLLRDSVREMDAVARYGGEELAVILPTTDLIHARALAERIRCSVASYEFTTGARKVYITVSIGLAVLPDHALTPVQLIDAADQALYTSKNQGRDQVCSYSGPVA